MSPGVRKPSGIAMILAIPLLFFSGLMFLGGWFDVPQWGSESAALIAFDIAILFTSFTTAVSALWILGSLGRNDLPVRIAGFSTLASGTLVLAAALSHVLPCSGPA